MTSCVPHSCRKIIAFECNVLQITQEINRLAIDETGCAMKSLLGNKLLPIALAVTATWVGAAEHRFNSVKGYLETVQPKNGDIMRLNVTVKSESEMRLMERALMELSVNYSKTDTGDGWVVFIESTFDKVKIILDMTEYKSASLILDPPEGIFVKKVNSDEVSMGESNGEDQKRSAEREVAIWSLSEDGDLINVNLNNAIFNKVGAKVSLNKRNFENAIHRMPANHHIVNFEEVSLENSHPKTRVYPSLTMGAFSDYRRDYAVKIKMPVDFLTLLSISEILILKFSAISLSQYIPVLLINTSKEGVLSLNIFLVQTKP